MIQQQKATKFQKLASTLTIPGLSFRGLAGESDYPKMVAVLRRCREVDDIEWIPTVEEMSTDYAHLTNCDPMTDMIIPEMDGEMIGYGRCWWHDLKDEGYSYYLFANLLPEWRNKGIRRAMVHHLENRLRTISIGHPAKRNKFFTSWAGQGQTHWNDLLLDEGYKVVRYGFDMVRPTLDDIPDCPIPEGIEVRRGTEAEWRQIWEAAREAFRDHWGMPEWSEEWFEAESKYPTFNPHLWQIAWEGDEVVGGVLNFIDENENEDHNRQRGYTETIFVRRPWRRRGVAKALISRSFQVLKDEGMTEAALGVDAENPTGAVQLYTGMGFQTVKQSATYRKPLWD